MLVQGVMERMGGVEEREAMGLLLVEQASFLEEVGVEERLTLLEEMVPQD